MDHAAKSGIDDFLEDDLGFAPLPPGFKREPFSILIEQGEDSLALGKLGTKHKISSIQVVSLSGHAVIVDFLVGDKPIFPRGIALADLPMFLAEIPEFEVLIIEVKALPTAAGMPLLHLHGTVGVKL